jgi:ATP-dependent Lon protease
MKEQILQFIATAKLKNTVQGKILTLYGPPGVGKTSFAFSVAKSLGRNVQRISLGGENNAIEMKGLRKTYSNSYCGKIIKALIDAKSENCVIILDEIDKLGKHSYNGDPESALLEILDPEQNSKFVDNYLDFPIDLSNVFFICTANEISNISSPLRDRMNLVEFNSYSAFEKLQIFNSHVYPDILLDFGLTNYQDRFELSEDCAKYLIEHYSREAGIRSLKKYTSQILQKVAYKILVELDEDEVIRISPENLSDYIGLPLYDEDFFYQGKSCNRFSSWNFNWIKLQ